MPMPPADCRRRRFHSYPKSSIALRNCWLPHAVRVLAAFVSGITRFVAIVAGVSATAFRSAASRLLAPFLARFAARAAALTAALSAAGLIAA
jgi:hypothetical protein